jgi:hypothetical protein
MTTMQPLSRGSHTVMRIASPSTSEPIAETAAQSAAGNKGTAA